jgi:hypothetical protein
MFLTLILDSKPMFPFTFFVNSATKESPISIPKYLIVICRAVSIKFTFRNI